MTYDEKMYFNGIPIYQLNFVPLTFPVTLTKLYYSENPPTTIMHGSCGWHSALHGCEHLRMPVTALQDCNRDLHAITGTLCMAHD